MITEIMNNLFGGIEYWVSNPVQNSISFEQGFVFIALVFILILLKTIRRHE